MAIGNSATAAMGVYSAECGEWNFSMNSGQDKEFLKKKMHFLGDILHILGDFGENFSFWGVILVQDLGRPPRDLGKIRISW